MPRTFRVCSMCTRNTYKDPDLSIFSVKNRRGNRSFVCEDHFPPNLIKGHGKGKRYKKAFVLKSL